MGPENKGFSPENKEQDPIEFHQEAIQRFEEMERIIVEDFSSAKQHTDMLAWIKREIEHHQVRISDIESNKDER